MTQAQKESLSAQLAAFPNVEFRAKREVIDGAETWVVRANGTSGQKVTSTTMTNIANAVVPGGVTALTDEVVFV